MVDTSVRGLPVMVFGASGALGRGLVTALVTAGAQVTGYDKVAPAASARAAGVTYREVDVTDDASLAAAFAGEPAWGVLNTIGGFAPHRPLTELDPAELTGQLTLNLLSAALITKHALAAMKNPGSGRIVHTASRAGVVSSGNGFAYSVSKLGVLHLVSMAADEVRGTGITVNCVVPSIIDTPANRAAMPNSDHASWPKVPDIAQTYLYLTSPGASLVNGAAVPV